MSSGAAELVSIIMPAYNAARHIAESIGSVISQTYPHWELLVVDDGSTDDTRSIVERLQQQDSRIRYVYQENARQGRARNNGIAQSTGAYIAFLDSDDLWFPQKLEIQLRALRESASDLVFSDAYVFQADFNPRQHTYHIMHSGRGTFEGDAGLKVFLKQNQIPILTALVKRQALACVGNFTENKRIQNAEDYHLWLKMLLNGSTFVGLKEVLAAYRMHATSVSSADRLTTQQAVEGKIDLSKQFPARRKLLLKSADLAVLHSISEMATYNSASFFATASHYLTLTDRAYWLSLFEIWQRLNLKPLAVLNLYFIYRCL